MERTTCYLHELNATVLTLRKGVDNARERKAMNHQKI